MHRVRHSLIRMPGVALAVLVVLLVSLNAFAAAENDTDRVGRISSLDMVDGDLYAVVRMLAKAGNMNIVIADPSIMHAKVTVTLHDVTPKAALEHVVRSVQGCVLDRQPDGTYYVRTATEADKAAQAKPAAESQTLVAQAIPQRGPIKTESIKLFNISPVDAMVNLGAYDLKEYNAIQTAERKPAYRRPAGAGLAPGSAAPTAPMTESFRNDPVVAQRAASVQEEAGQYGYGGPYGQPYGGGAPYGGAPYGNPYQPTVIGGSVGQPYGQPGYATQPYGATGSMSGFGGAGSMGQQSDTLMPVGIDFMMPYALDNTLIVKGDEEGIEELKEVLKLIDIPPIQLLCKLEQVQMSRAQVNALGVTLAAAKPDWDEPTLLIESTFGVDGPAGLEYQGTIPGGFWAAFVKATDGRTHGKVVKSAEVTTFSGVPASVTTQTVYPYVTSYSVLSGDTVTTNQSVNSVPVVTNFPIVPRVNPADNTITLQAMTLTNSDVTGNLTTEEGDIPITTSSSVTFSRRIHSGDTIVIYGTVSKSDLFQENRFPLLAELPIIGQLFRSKNKSENDVETLTFITITIIPERLGAESGIGVRP